MIKPRQIKDHTKLICDISELSGLFTDSTSLDSFLQKIVDMIASHMQSEVCSIYLYYEQSKELVLRATKGLNENLIGEIRMQLGEGLTGLALKELRPICERNASRNRNFRYFPGLGEEQFETFLAVPISRGTTMIGVMVIQNTVKDYFNDEDIQALRAISSQLAHTIELTQLILSIEEKKEIESQEEESYEDLTLIKGQVGSPGFAYAEVYPIGDHGQDLMKLVEDVEKEFSLDDFYKAVHETERQLEDIQEEIEEKLSDVASLIFAAQILMLKDNAFIDAIAQQIRQGTNAPVAVAQVVHEYVQKFEDIANPYLREKSFDVRDIGKRLLNNLLDEDLESVNLDRRIIIAQDLVPSDALKLSSQNVKGIILLHGGATSHLSILARSLEIPLIIADVPGLMRLPEHTKVLMDGEQGNIFVNPEADVVQTFREKENAALKLREMQNQISDKTLTADKKEILLMANINLLGDLQNARDYRAAGVGLYRTEFPFIVRNNFPSEEEQYVIYRKLIEGMPDKETTFRTLDIGGDKVLSYFKHHHKEKNPYLGMRSIRFSLQHSDIFSQQIRAILRAGVDSDVRIMFPMISSLDEFLKAKAIVMQCVDDLRNSRIPCNTHPSLGLMIELPSVLEIIDELAIEADFFSIGTNDFIQYMLAVDRTNEKVADMYVPYHPSILRGLRRIAIAAKKGRIDISVCGDMAHKEAYIQFLIGIGIMKFSVDATYIPHLQNAIKSIHCKKARKLAQKVLTKSRSQEIKGLLGVETN